ncbi:MAG: hypothetical protein WAS05_04025 [Candidatus Nanopelagicales bacterium]
MAADDFLAGALRACVGLRLLDADEREEDLEPERVELDREPPEREELARDDLGSDDPRALPVFEPLLLERDVGVPVAIL